MEQKQINSRRKGKTMHKRPSPTTSSKRNIWFTGERRACMLINEPNYPGETNRQFADRMKAENRTGQSNRLR